MKQDYKVWAVILGIIIAGVGITAFTNTYVSGRSSEASGYEVAFAETAAAAGAAAEDTEGENIEIGEAAESYAAEITSDELTLGAAADRADAGGEETLLDSQIPAPEEAEEGTESIPMLRSAAGSGADALSEDDAEADQSQLPAPRALVTGPGDGIAVTESSGTTSGSMISGSRSIKEEAKNKVIKADAAEETADYRETLADYLERLGELDAQIERMRKSETDNTVHSVKSAAQTEQRIWERELDAVYTLLIGSLDEESGGELRSEQQKWIISRDQKAQDASKKNSGGSMESVEYIASIAASTRERVYELVEQYR